MRKLLSLAVVMFMAIGMPATSEARGHQHSAHQASPAGGFDYYVLSLSWAPTYCASHSDDTSECSSPHGFVVHGLWPQYAAGGYPQTCSGRLLNAEEQQAATAVYPSAQLAAHEWAKHGTCSGLEPTAYFKAAADARDGIQIPPELEPGERNVKLRAADIVRAMRGANPSLPANAIAVVCAQRSMSEVRVCLNKDLSPRACGRDVKTSCGTGAVSVPGAH